MLKAFVELYCNFWRKSLQSRIVSRLIIAALEDRVFTMKRPSAFYSMFGNVGGAASGDLAMEAFEDDVKLAGRQVRYSQSPASSPMLTVTGAESPNRDERNSLHPILPANTSSCSGSPFRSSIQHSPARTTFSAIRVTAMEISDGSFRCNATARATRNAPEQEAGTASTERPRAVSHQ